MAGSAPAIVSALTWKPERRPAHPPALPQPGEACFEGSELLEPGVVSLPRRRPGSFLVGELGEAAQQGGVTHKP